MDAIEARNKAEGCVDEENQVLECSAILKEEREKHITKTKLQIKALKPGSKQWHAKSSELLGDEPKTCNIPALKDEKGAWVLSPKGKADLLATTMANKFALGPSEPNRFSKLHAPKELQWSLQIPTENDAIRILTALSEDSGTGPDAVTAFILKVYESVG